MNKNAIRTMIKEKKAELSTGYVWTYSLEVCNTFLQSDAYKNAKVIYTYLAYNQEIVTDTIIDAAWKDGKIVAVPKVLDEGTMEFFKIDSFDNIDFGYCKIPEPTGNEPIMHEKDVLMILPGLAFDKNNNRLGYGGGFYDRYIEKEERAGTKFYKVSLAYDFQILDELPVEDHDKKVDIIISKM